MNQSGKVAQADKFRGHIFGFASSWTKVAQADKLKGRQCILLFSIAHAMISMLFSLENLWFHDIFQTGKSKHYGFIEFESPVVRTLFQISLQQIYAISWLLTILITCFGVTGVKDCS